MGLVGRLIFNAVPTGARITMDKPNGIAIFHSISPFVQYVNAAEELFITFNNIPKGIASVLKSIPIQKRIGMYNCEPPIPSIENKNDIRKKMGGTR